MYLNKVFLYGNLTRDPEVKALPSGTQVANFAIATNRVYKDKNGAKQESVEFHNVVAFGKLAEIIGQYMKKGRPLFVEGRIQTRSWDATDGSGKKYKTEIIAENFQFGPSGQGGGGSTSNRQPTTDNVEAKQDEPASGIAYPEEEIKAEDIPF
ncbi:MAG: single-stranded DNA-binding protein [Candidatus Peregrinibacteria bacterium]|nr:single-stranded DNA-binding protein [Candidatus Peregrinibacteria bacterium]